MRDDGTMLGIIATKKAFPAEHLSEPMYVQLERQRSVRHSSSLNSNTHHSLFRVAPGGRTSV